MFEEVSILILSFFTDFINRIQRTGRNIKDKNLKWNNPSTGKYFIDVLKKDDTENVRIINIKTNNNISLGTVN